MTQRNVIFNFALPLWVAVEMQCDGWNRTKIYSCMANVAFLHPVMQENLSQDSIVLLMQCNNKSPVSFFFTQGALGWVCLGKAWLWHGREGLCALPGLPRHTAGEEAQDTRCKCLCMCACVHVCVCVCMYECACVHLCMCAFVCVFTQADNDIHACTSKPHMFITSWIYHFTSTLQTLCTCFPPVGTCA